jgi:hypothetical protein
MRTKKLLFGLLLAGAITMGLQPLSAKVWYVGTTWSGKPTEDVKATIPDAITAAGSNADQIWVAGSYTVDATISLNDKKVSLYGGFAGTESSIDERAKVSGGKAWEFANPTVLTYTATGISISKKLDVPVVIDGFTLQGPNNDSDVRGISVNNNGSKITIANCIVQGFGKQGTTDGGGIDVRGTSSNATIEACLVQNNRGKNGGGIYTSQNVNNLIKSCEILNNTTATTGNGTTHNPAHAAATPSASNWGGGVLLNNATITNCLVAGNTAYAGGGITVRENTAKVIGCVVVNNTATYGGGIAFDKRVTTGTIINSTVAANTATDGAGVALSDNGQSMYNTILWGNKRDGVVENVVAKLSGGVAKTPTLQNNISDVDLNAYGTGNLVAADSAAIFAEDWKLSATSAAVNAGSSEEGKYSTTDIVDRLARGVRDIGAYEYAEDIVIAEDATVTTDYDVALHGDVIFKSNNASTGQWSATNTAVTDGVIKLKKTFTTGKWYPVGFPFELASVSYEGQGVYPYALQAFSATEVAESFQSSANMAVLSAATKLPVP